jgi:ubiquitin-like 1-activating enzyme E1 B
MTAPATKRARTDVLASPSKKRRLEEDGLLLLESKDDKIEDEVIMVD